MTADDRLKELEAGHPELVTPDSPTVRVGGGRARDFRRAPRAADAEPGQRVFL